MANNPYVNKVVYGNQTVMDISDSDVQEGDVVSGKTFYKGNGQRSTGSAVIPDISNCYQTTDTAETTIDDADYFPFYDDSASAKRKSLWSNIKAKLKTYFDTLYATLTDRDNLIITLPYADYQLLTPEQQSDPHKVYYVPDAPDEDDMLFPRSEQRVLGAKNLLPMTAKTQTLNNVVFTVYEDGSFKANGTSNASGNTFFNFYPNDSSYVKNIWKGQKISGISGGSGTTFFFCIMYSNNGTSYVGELDITNGEQIIGDYDYIKFTLCVKSGATLNDKMFYPMIRLASDPDNTYVPYAMTNRQLTVLDNIKVGIGGVKQGTSSCKYMQIKNRVFVSGYFTKPNAAWGLFSGLPTPSSDNTLCGFATDVSSPTGTIYSLVVKSNGDIQVQTPALTGNFQFEGSYTVD